MHMTIGIGRYMRRTRRPTSPPIPDKKPKEQQIADWKAKGGDGGKGQGKGQAKGGEKGYVGGPSPDRRVRSIEEVAEDMLRTLDELKAQQRGGQSLSGSQQEGAAAGHV